MTLDEYLAIKRAATPNLDTQMLAWWNAEVCAGLGVPIEDDEPVWIDTVARHLKAPICRSCAQTSFPGAERAGPCDGCGREVHIRERLGRLHLFCCGRCEARFYTTQRKARRSLQRRRHCYICGKIFQPRQSNARTCGSVCRQKAYRARKRTAETGEGTDLVTDTLFSFAVRDGHV